jgi:hypothetical protein
MSRIERAANPLRFDLFLGQYATECRALRRTHLARSDLELHHLPTLREDEASRVENVTARRRHLARRELLPRRPRAPRVTLKQLHLRRLPDDNQRERRQQRVHDLDAT